MNKDVSKTIGPWLKANLGVRCLAGLTGQDWPALKTAVHAVELWFASDYSGRRHAAAAFGAAVNAMQPALRYLAFHAVAHVGDWGHRWELWRAAGLATDDLKHAPECKYGPRRQPEVAAEVSAVPATV